MHPLRPIVASPLNGRGWTCYGCLEKLTRRQRHRASQSSVKHISTATDLEESFLENLDGKGTVKASASIIIPSVAPANEPQPSTNPQPKRRPIKIAKIQPYRFLDSPKDNKIKKRVRSTLAILDTSGDTTESKIRFHAADFHIRNTTSSLVRYTKFEHANQPEGESPEEEPRLRIRQHASASTMFKNENESKTFEQFEGSPSERKPQPLIRKHLARTRAVRSTTLNDKSGFVSYTHSRHGLPVTREQRHRGQTGVRMPSSRSFSTSTRHLELSTVADKESQTPHIPHPATDQNIYKRLRQYQKNLDAADISRRVTLGLATSKDPVDLYTIEPEDHLEEDRPFDEEEEQQDDLEQDDLVQDEAAFVRPTISPGDLIEVMLGGIPSPAVIIERYELRAGALYLVVTHVGSWEYKVFTYRNNPSFVIRGHFKLSELEMIKQFLPSSPPMSRSQDQRQDEQDEHDRIPPEISHSVTRKLRAFQQETDKIYRLHATDIDNVFERLAKQDEAVHIRLEDIARKALRIKGQIRNEALYAVHRACTQYSTAFLINKNHWFTREFELLSKKELAVIEQVRMWVREHSDLAISKSNGNRLAEVSVLDEFAEEIRPIILESRRSRESLPGAHLGPFRPPEDLVAKLAAGQTLTSGPISSNGLLILSFIRLWCERLSDTPGARILTALGSIVMKSIGLYDDLTVSRGRKESLGILKECGVVPPWQIPGDRGNTMSNIYKDPNSLMSRLFSQAQAEIELGNHQIDVMKELRHDWGDMPVYCVDSATTAVVDDGISLEKTSESGVYWVHVHVANPTAFIPPDSKVSALAQEPGETIYLPHRRYHMFPFDTFREGFSLHPGCPTLTFSTKINTEGVVLDRQVRNGRIHNILHITPETVSKHTEEASSYITPPNIYTVGLPYEASLPKKHITSTLSSDAISTLKTLKSLSAAWEGYEASARGLTWQFNPDSWMSINVNDLEEGDIDQNSFRRFSTDPSIHWHARPWNPYHRAPIRRHTAREMVTSVMQMANNTAAEWCSERGVSILFRGCAVKGYKDVDAEMIQPLRHTGDLSTDFQEFCRRSAALGLGTRTTLTPYKVAHDLIGVDAYARITSPLRRYEDMVNHWQIEAALRNEARSGRQMTEYNTSPSLFSREMLKKQIVKLTESSLFYKLQASQCKQYWATEFLVRGIFFGECQELPELYTFYIVSANKTFLRGYVAEMACQSTIALESVWNPPQVGQVWKARLNIEDLTTTSIRWKLVERIA